jgi:hypothetical protein
MGTEETMENEWAGSPQGISPPGLPQIRTCTFVHTARHIMSSLCDGTPSVSQSAAEAWDKTNGDIPQSRRKRMREEWGHPSIST